MHFDAGNEILANNLAATAQLYTHSCERSALISTTRGSSGV